MAVVNQIEKKVKISTAAAVKCQIVIHCLLSNISLSPAEINCLTYLALLEEQELNLFCQKASSLKLFQSSQTVRNAIRKMEKQGLITKEGKSKKKIFVNPDLKIQTKGNLFLNYKMLAVEASKS